MRHVSLIESDGEWFRAMGDAHDAVAERMGRITFADGDAVRSLMAYFGTTEPYQFCFQSCSAADLCSACSVPLTLSLNASGTPSKLCNATAVGVGPRNEDAQQLGALLLGLSPPEPIEMLEVTFGWRGVFWVLTGVALMMAVMVYTVVPQRKEKHHGSETLGETIGGIRLVFWSPLFWRIAPLCVTSQAAFLGIQSLWLGPWFHDVLALDARATADALSHVAMAMVASYACLAWITGYLSKRGVPAIKISVIGMSVFIVMQVLIVAEVIPVTATTWMIWAFTGTYGIVTYAGLTQRFPTRLAGRVVTGINVLAFFGAFGVQWGIGVIIDFWPLSATGGFHPEGYRWAFGMVALLQGLALIWYLVFRTERVVESPA